MEDVKLHAGKSHTKRSDWSPEELKDIKALEKVLFRSHAELRKAFESKRDQLKQLTPRSKVIFAILLMWQSFLWEDNISTISFLSAFFRFLRVPKKIRNCLIELREDYFISDDEPKEAKGYLDSVWQGVGNVSSYGLKATRLVWKGGEQAPKTGEKEFAQPSTLAEKEPPLVLVLPPRVHWQLLWELLLMMVGSGAYLATHRATLRALASSTGYPFYEVSPFVLPPAVVDALQQSEKASYLFGLVGEAPSVPDYRRCIISPPKKERPIAWERVEAAEDGLAVKLRSVLREIEEKHKKETASSGRWWKIGLGATVGGGLLLVTGGLAAPIVIPAAGGMLGLLAAGSVAVGLSSVAAVATTAGTVLVVGGTPLVASLFGITGAGIVAKKVSKRTGSVEDFYLIPVRKELDHLPSRTHEEVEPQGLHVWIGVTGYAKDDEEFVKEWRRLEQLHPFGETYALIWERKHVFAFCKSMVEMLGKEIAKEMVKKWAELSSLALIKAIAVFAAAFALPLAAIKLSGVIDNSWHMAMNRAEKAGKALAACLVERVQGCRPVSLCGYSIGARVIFFCLEELAARRANGIVFDAVLMGAPVSSSPARWNAIRSVTAGRLVNVYSRNDWVLALCFRTANLTYGVAGLQAIGIKSSGAGGADEGTSETGEVDHKLPEMKEGLSEVEESIKENETPVSKAKRDDKENRVDEEEEKQEAKRKKVIEVEETQGGGKDLNAAFGRREIENLSVEGIISWHSDYATNATHILGLLGFVPE